MCASWRRNLVKWFFSAHARCLPIAGLLLCDRLCNVLVRVTRLGHFEQWLLKICQSSLGWASWLRSSSRRTSTDLEEALAWLQATVDDIKDSSVKPPWKISCTIFLFLAGCALFCFELRARAFLSDVACDIIDVIVVTFPSSEGTVREKGTVATIVLWTVCG